MTYSAPSSILIIGSGVFGLSTAEALTRRPEFAHATITVVDRGSHEADGDNDDDKHFPARDAASIDSSRIIRPDYADPAYAALAAEAQAMWRGPVSATGERTGLGQDHIGGQGRYTESGLIVIADADVETDQPKKKLGKKTGLDYVRESWTNVSALAEKDPYMAKRLQQLPDPEAIRTAIGTGGTTGSWGYINRASGWANAEASIAWVLGRVRKTGRVQFVRGRVTSLIQKDETVAGVHLDDGRTLTADLVVAAAGAWTESLMSAAGLSVPSSSSSLSGTLAATGQVLGYVPLASAEEHAAVAGMPVVLNLSTGLFVIPPAPESRELKVARHSYGYVNPVNASGGSSRSVSLVSTPLTHEDDPQLAIPAEGAADLRRGLRAMVPLPGLAERPFDRTRICWYTDTPTGDFLIDYHPQWRGLFLATGGSGHGFKFLPVLGEKIVDCIVGKPPAAFQQKWAWRQSQSQPGSAKAVVTEDGSRGGQPGLVLQDELAKY